MTNDAGRLATAIGGRYTIERVLGRGGMATVYLAQDVKHHREVAVKVLDPELTAAIGSARFLREIEVAARHHPHILPLHDSGDAAGTLYYVMPYVEGESLQDRLRREGQLAIDDAIRIAREVAGALAYAHGSGTRTRPVVGYRGRRPRDADDDRIRHYHPVRRRDAHPVAVHAITNGLPGARRPRRPLPSRSSSCSYSGSAHPRQANAGTRRYSRARTGPFTGPSSDRVYILIEDNADLVLYNATRGITQQYRLGEAPDLQRLNAVGYVFESEEAFNGPRRGC